LCTRFVMSSVRLHGTIRLPLDGFLMKFHFWVFSEKLPRIFKSHYNLTIITGTLHEDHCTFSIISRSVLLRTKNVSDKSCRESRNTPCTFNDLCFRKSSRLWDNVEKYCRVGQATDENMAHAGYMRIKIHTLRLRNTHCFSTTTMVARTRLNVTLYVLHIGCLC
jgi:hypothetical protein